MYMVIPSTGIMTGNTTGNQTWILKNDLDLEPAWWMQSAHCLIDLKIALVILETVNEICGGHENGGSNIQPRSTILTFNRRD